MRRKAKKQIIDILDTLSRAHTQAARLSTEGGGREAEATGLLIQCQEGAQKIGETIEQTEGEGTRAVACLERYCEALYQMSLEMAEQAQHSRGGQEGQMRQVPDDQMQTGPDDRTCQGRRVPHGRQEKQIAVPQGTETAGIAAVEELAARLDALLKEIRREVVEVLPTDKIKICFLPYKASMWDCMESVWEAAAADGECEAKVVPIPYYERDDQGKITRECYDGELFPSYVPVTPYRSYDLSKERPDILYIHNPYDGGNTVTTVHPDYFSSNLKKYTDLLVYIPYYFIGNGPLPDCHLSLPAYEYVDRIIVQDEEKVDALADFVPREKILAIGSPKVDRILKLDRQKEELIEKEIPAQWREKIQGKKVILYNISVTGILRNSRYLLDKIRYVLSCFEGREDVVLWWRPHPLLEATIKSAMPELYQSYQEIKHAFAESRNGILDESGDASVAAVIADAYLGENSSSLMHYFGVLGKPVMYTRWEIAEDRKKDRDFLHFNPYYKEGDLIFFVPSTIGFDHELYQMDLRDGNIKKTMTFPGTPSDKWGCYWGIKKIKNKILLVPHNTEDVYIYDLEKSKGIKLVLSESNDRMMLFDEAVEYGGKVFLLPRCYPAIVRIDVESLEVCEYKECIKPFLQEDSTQQMFYWAFTKKEQYLYLASCNESKILIFNMEDGTYQTRQISDRPYGYYSMLYDGRYFWLGAFKASCIVRWDEKNGDIKEYVYPTEHEPEIEGYHYTPLLDHGEELIICYGSSAEILFMDKETGRFRKSGAVEGILEKIREETTNSAAGLTYARPLDEENVVVFDAGCFSFNIWDTRTDRWKRFLCRTPADEMLRIEKRMIERYHLIKATPYCLWEDQVTIPQFIDYIVAGDVEAFKQTYVCYQDGDSDAAVGRQIHDEVRREMIER